MVKSGSVSRREEDYLEAIFNIINEKGYARIKDIAKELDVTPPSVTEMVRRLDDKSLVDYRKYDGINLTPEGNVIGRMVKERHDTIERFLRGIGVPDDIADRDACIMEHELDPVTISRLRILLDKWDKA